MFLSVAGNFKYTQYCYYPQLELVYYSFIILCIKWKDKAKKIDE